MNRTHIIATLFLFTILTACAQSKKKDFVVTIKTNYGDMVAILYDETPKHKENFIKLAKQKFFDSTLFHRVMPKFMIQGGDPKSKKALPSEPLGNGGLGYTIDAEFVPKYFHEKGALAAARVPDQMNPSRASSSSQFYIVQGQVWKEGDLKIDQNKLGMALQQMFALPQNKTLYDSLIKMYQSGDMKAYEAKIISLAPRVEKEMGVKIYKDIAPERLTAYTTVGGYPPLDDQYTVFGKVIKGLDVIDKIAAVTTGQSDRPIQDVRMTVTLEEVSKKKITKLYGYNYSNLK